jgi:hypothetical protein
MTIGGQAKPPPQVRKPLLPRFIDTDYFSPELKLILAREYRERNGGTNMIKYDRIYPLKG